jgi:hypothetical protein
MLSAAAKPIIIAHIDRLVALASQVIREEG